MTSDLFWFWFRDLIMQWLLTLLIQLRQWFFLNQDAVGFQSGANIC